MKARIQLLVTVTVDGDYYFDADDLANNVTGWIEAALDDRDDIDAYGDGLTIQRAEGVKL